MLLAIILSQYSDNRSSILLSIYKKKCYTIVIMNAENELLIE